MDTTWNIDQMHSEIGFKVKHMMISNVRGSFGSFRAKAETNGDTFDTAKLSFEADIDSITTGVADRDTHLKSEDFFNAASFPTMKFESSKVSLDGDDITIEGNMTIRDVTKPIKLTGEFGGVATDPYGQTKAGFTVNGKIKRSEFGLTWSAVTEAGSIVVSDDIHIQNEIQFVKE